MRIHKISAFLCLLLCAALLWLPALADGDEVIGTSEEAVTVFTATAAQDTSLTLLPFNGTVERADGQPATVYGVFTVNHYVDGLYAETLRMQDAMPSVFALKAGTVHTFEVFASDLATVEMVHAGLNPAGSAAYLRWTRPAGWYVSSFGAQVKAAKAQTEEPQVTQSPQPLPPVVSKPAFIEIYYMTPEDELLSSEFQTLSAGTYIFTSKYGAAAYFEDGQYTLAGPETCEVTISDDGTATPNPVIFRYAWRKDQPQGADQTAVIEAQKIYPRPGPGVGKNAYNYEVPGQTVTVHAKGKSSPTAQTWWVCFSGDLHCEGTVYHIDHEWIAADYLDPASFDLNALPVDTSYYP